MVKTTVEKLPDIPGELPEKQNHFIPSEVTINSDEKVKIIPTSQPQKVEELSTAKLEEKGSPLF